MNRSLFQHLHTIISLELVYIYSAFLLIYYILYFIFYTMKGLLSYFLYLRTNVKLTQFAFNLHFGSCLEPNCTSRKRPMLFDGWPLTNASHGQLLVIISIDFNYLFEAFNDNLRLTELKRESLEKRPVSFENWRFTKHSKTNRSSHAMLSFVNKRTWQMYIRLIITIDCSLLFDIQSSAYNCIQLPHSPP